MTLYNKITIACLAIISTVILSGCTEKPEEPAPLPPRYGIVNTEKLLKAHKDWQKLEQLDKRLEKIKASIGEPGSSLENLGEKQALKMKQAQKQAETELQAQLAQVKASLEAHKAEVAEKMAREADIAKKKMKELSSSSSVQKPARKQAELGKDLISLRDRQIVAKKLELQKQAKERMEALKTQLDNELAAYERMIATENQQQRINLQLKLQLDISEEERKKISEEISAISEEENRLKSKKRDEQGKKIEQEGAKELAAVEREVEAYKQKVDADIKKQLGLNVSKYSQSEIQRKSNEIMDNYARKQQALESSIHSASAASEATLAKKQAELQARLQKLQKGMMKEVAQSREKLIKSDMERIKKLQEQYIAEEKQRAKLYDAMIEDIRSAVNEVAVKENYTAVFMTYIINITAEDITEKSIEALKLLSRR